MCTQLDGRGDSGDELSAIFLPGVVGCVPHDGWLVLEKHVENMDELDQPPPRNYGVTDQIKTDLRAPIAVIGWAVILGSIIYGIATLNWIAIGVFTFALLYLGSSSRRNILLTRRGVIGTGVVDRIDTDSKIIGTTENVSIDGKLMRVGFDVQAMRTLLSLGSVEVRVLYDPEDPIVGHAFGYRPDGAKRTEPLPEL